ncbi:hypothetical protein SEA_TAPIOCA_24 [Mycobacterium phage Tapioca]|uniref:Uncharacterized protein n=14 Tax=Caudoviricetes TaxID=2731619 RepID=G1FTW2_9CAUD|nr:virion structural protein [Mycobacterium phage Charlie]YP_009197149.1 virion structural protein [Mycobacterium phage Carcharodon]YP_009616877.1 virion structural protein [Mycobacterium phage Pipsqueaks]YP_010051888.1 virion structural protein [Mycobacterium phage Philonius]YP_010051960.1 virion structural protein [Mycobacterium phage Aggie]YP_010052297.1 virion structural protein [Mycobacterium phage Tapioca]YP_010754816.1 hypothetical protein QEH38_gp27 [Mycobacterium phage LilSpotty]AMS
MARGFYLTNACAQGMLNGTGLAESLGASPVIKIYSGTVPANADAANSGTVLAVLPCSATPFSGFSDTGSAARATFGPITSDASADNSGTAAFFRIETSSGTVRCQGTVGTSDADLILNTVAITAGSTVAISSAYIDLPEGP